MDGYWLHALRNAALQNLAVDSCRVHPNGEITVQLDPYGDKTKTVTFAPEESAEATFQEDDLYYATDDEEDSDDESDNEFFKQAPPPAEEIPDDPPAPAAAVHPAYGAFQPVGQGGAAPTNPNAHQQQLQQPGRLGLPGQWAAAPQPVINNQPIVNNTPITQPSPTLKRGTFSMSMGTAKSAQPRKKMKFSFF